MTRTTARLVASAAAPFLVAVLAACPKDKPAKDTAAAIPVDTTPADLSNVTSAIPAADPDTFKVVDPNEKNRGKNAGGNGERYPQAPEALQAAVQREQSASRFCYQEFGQKADPQLRGAVNMVVTVGSGGITDAKVGASNWTGSAGRAVNTCLNERLTQAWKLAPGAVRPGKYTVTLQFRGG
jgi:hypothetical protein